MSSRGRQRLLAVVVVALVLAACAGGSKDGSTGTTRSSSPASKADAKASPGTTAPTTTVVPVVRKSKGCGADASLRPGRFERKLHSGQFDRDYVLYVPKGYRAGKPVPVVLNFHGLTSPIAGQELISDFHAKADEVTALEVLPLGRGAGTIPAWNVARFASWPDDAAFVNDLLDTVEAQACVDLSHVFAVGLSNGAQMTSFVACNLSQRVAAFATVAGIYDPGDRDCKLQRPVPIIAFHGTADPFLPFNGSAGPAVGRLPLDQATIDGITGIGPHLAPIKAVAARWAQRDGCRRQQVERRVSGHVTFLGWTGCRGGADVQLYVVDGGGHTWPGSKGSKAVAAITGPTTFEVNANDLIWKFLQAHPLS